MGAYAHLFGFVEEFIAPKMVALARDFEIEKREAFDALTNFAAEEVKHMNLFRGTHPNFQELFGAVTTPAQQQRVQQALTGLLKPAA
jgi:hypothetical protein